MQKQLLIVCVVKFAVSLFNKSFNFKQQSRNNKKCLKYNRGYNFIYNKNILTIFLPNCNSQELLIKLFLLNILVNAHPQLFVTILDKHCGMYLMRMNLTETERNSRPKPLQFTFIKCQWRIKNILRGGTILNIQVISHMVVELIIILKMYNFINLLPAKI